MKRYPTLFLFLLFITACGKKNKPAQEDDVNTATSFIRAALDGKFNEARRYMLPDSVNNNWMDIAERNYQKSDRDTKTGYATSSINIHDVHAVNDSTTLLIYSNSFKNDHDTLKIIKENNRWLVDLKYLFQHGQDSIGSKNAVTDSI